MSFQTLLVHVEPDSTPDPRLALAIDLANQLDAKLIGVGAEMYGAAGMGGGMDYGSPEIFALLATTTEENVKRAEAKFHAAAVLVKRGSQWKGAVQYPTAKVVAEARAADLVITSQTDGKGGSELTVAPPGPLILQAGRPVLVVPPKADHLTIKNIVVAWKEAREARRVVADALPFLKAAASVVLVEICDSVEADPATRQHLAEIGDYLSRHGVKASILVVAETRLNSAAEQLLDIAKQQKADLIVAGAYGHSRFQEWVFGGFTRALLGQTELAVLFSH